MTVAEKIIKPTQAGIFRTVFLYTGQGESTLLVIPTGESVNDYMYVLLDSDKDNEINEINLIELFKDLFITSGNLSIFLNTHPHNDHFGGIREIYDVIGFLEVWHSNHKPGGKHKKNFEDFQYVIQKIGKSNEYHLKGSNELNKIRTTADREVIKNLGLINFQVLSPAEYLCDDIDEEHADERNKRIHEQCAVIKFTYGTYAKSIMFTGDSNKKAWKEHITDYYKDNLESNVLSASHHASRSFFKEGKEDVDVYETHIENINPTYLIISAPKQEESPHGHPHNDAMDLYKKHVEEEGIFHLGSGPYSVIVDIDKDGNISVETDTELIETYGNGNDDNDNDNEKGNDNNVRKSIYIVPSTTRIDQKPMGTQ